MPTTPGSPPASPPSCSTSPRCRASTCAAAAPGTRESVLLDPSMTVERIDAIALVRRLGLRPRSRGRRAGAAARTGPRLRDAHRAGADRAGRDPVRPAQWRRQGLGPLPALSRARLCGRGRGRATTFALGTAGAGFGATTANFKGGIGSASAMTRDGITVGALVAVNAAGCVTVGDGPHGSGRRRSSATTNSAGAACRRRFRPDALAFRTKGRAAENTTLARGRDRRDPDQGPGQAARDHGAGSASPVRSVRCTPRSTATSCSPRRPARKPLPDPIHGLAELGSAAADVLARAVARGGLRGHRAAVPGRLAGLAGSFWNNWITGVPKGSAALTLRHRWLANVTCGARLRCGARVVAS